MPGLRENGILRSKATSVAALVKQWHFNEQGQPPPKVIRF